MDQDRAFRWRGQLVVQVLREQWHGYRGTVTAERVSGLNGRRQQLSVLQRRLKEAAPKPTVAIMGRSAAAWSVGGGLGG